MQIACVGNAILDVLIQFPSSDISSYVSQDHLQFPLGEKILTSSSEVALGGNACNVSVGLSRLGYQATLFAEVGDDLFSTYLQEALRKEQVDTSHMVKKGKTTLDVALNAVEDRVILVDKQPRDNAFSLPYETLDGIYLTSLGDNWESVYQEILSSPKVPVYCNPGTLQLKEKETLLPLLPGISILFLNVEEAAHLSGYETQLKKGKNKAQTKEHIHHLFEKVFALGPQIVIITDGIEGAYAGERAGKIYFAPTFSTPVLEKTGAGDSFASGFIASYLETKSLEEALISGTSNGSSVVEYVGAQKGLLTKEGMIERKKLATLPLEVI